MLKRGSNFLPMLYKLTIGGGLVFWATTFATSLLPIAAAYRVAFSNWSIHTVWIASLPVGILMGCFVAFTCFVLWIKINRESSSKICETKHCRSGYCHSLDRCTPKFSWAG